MFKNTITKKDNSIQIQNVNIPFLSPMEISSQSSQSYNTARRIQEWTISNDDVSFVNERLLDSVEQKIVDIDSGKEKLTKYSDSNEYLKHVKKVLDE